ncbi:hypothetical protein O3P69_019346 [Scylla paramamosain]|uniref:Uncharacterized protein n=1 Tax=Scylla paramamosain TaxID=85552 RepID=A0AAW0SXH2_SCYPA
MAGLCGGCDIPSWVVFGRFHGEIPGNAENALQFLRDHGVLPRCVTKYVRPGSVVVCGQWGASLSLHKLGYTFITAQADEEEESDSATPKAEVEGEEPDYTTATPRTDLATPATPAEEEKETQTHLEPRECTTTRASNFEKTSHATPTRQKTHALPVTQIAEDLDKPGTHTTADTSPAAARHPPAHTETIRDLWKDLKDWVRKPGMRLDYFQEYLSRFLFIRHHKDQHLHRFFIETARLFPPHADLSAPTDAPTDTPADTPADTHQGTHKSRYAENVEFGETSD